MIYGKEIVEYTHNVVDDNSAVIDNTLDWLLEDTLLDTTDNTTILTDMENTAPQTKSYESSGTKDVSTTIDFDDGWGNIYTHATAIVVETHPYDVPQLGLSWLPVAPTVLDTVEFTQAHNDTRNADNTYGRIDAVSVDYYDDGNNEETNLTDVSSFTNTFPVKSDSVPIRLIADYWDGWETRQTSLLSSMPMTNIPPVSDNTRMDSGQCTPAYTWTATSTDVDDAVDELSYTWTLYKDNAGAWEVVSSGTGTTYMYPFQYEGDYKLVMRTTDDSGDWTEKEEPFTITFDTCGANSMSGVIRLESDRFEMVSIPVKGVRVNEYFISKLEEITGAPAIESIDFIKAYPSNTVSSGKYLGFVPGVTNPESTYNFKLVEDDNGVEAHVPFFVRTKVLDAPIEIPWDTSEGIV